MPNGPQETVKAEDGSVAIRMSCGLWFVVDAEDYERVSALRWHSKRRLADPGRVYVQRTERLTPGRAGKKTAIALHRWLLDAGPGQFVDHINGNPLDNRRANLRLCTAAQNSQNVTSSKKQKRGEFKGAHWCARAKKWEAYACTSNERLASGRRKRTYLGLYHDPINAARAYDREAFRVFGEFAALNFPDLAPGIAVELAARALAGVDVAKPNREPKRRKESEWSPGLDEAMKTLSEWVIGPASLTTEAPHA